MPDICLESRVTKQERRGEGEKHTHTHRRTLTLPPHYTLAHAPPLPSTHTHATKGYIFDQFWLQKKPENVMAFQDIKSEFEAEFTQRLEAKNITLSMHL